MNMAPQTRTVTVSNPEGLHARPAHLLVQLASKFESNILIGKDSELVDCKSILSLLTLGAGKGTELSVTAQGADAAAALESIVQLIEADFDDPKMQGVEPAVDS
jgi:phosphocarrier protein HPr